MPEQTSTLPSSPLQAAVEASFTLRGWRYEVATARGEWITSTTVQGPGGPALLEVTVRPEARRIVLRVDLGLRCRPETRAETALFLGYLALWLDLTVFALGPTTGDLYLRLGLSEGLGARLSAESVDRALGHLAECHGRFAPLVARVCRGELTAAEARRHLR
ncbi:MAG TPA: hypothetical protein VFS07_08280 [Gemmatimonadales bacterium]|nr:hypothetical protein [Gemmatimonadales bacterium]